MVSQNRGNPSMGNSNTRPDGVNRSSSEAKDYNALRSMQIANMQIVDMLNKITKNGSLDKFEETVNELSKNLIENEKNDKKRKKEIDEELHNFKIGLAKEIQLNEKKKGHIINIVEAYKLMKNSEELKKFQLEQDRELTKLKNKMEEEEKKARIEILKQSFKNETESKQIKYLDNNYSKGNNLASKSNEYYSQLEKLKSEALETYGEGFDTDKNNKGYKEYKKALMNLNENYAKEMKDSWKEDFKENHKVLSSVGEGINKTFEKNKESLMGVLGPLNLIFSPLKDFFGGFGTVFKILGTGIKKLFTAKFNKKNPSATDVMKSGAFGVGSLFIANKLEKMFGKTEGEENKSKLDKVKDLLFGKVYGELNGKKFRKGGLVGGASKFLTIGHGAVAGGLGVLGGGALMAKDTMKGVQMAGQGEWSESKIASGMGGLLGGFDRGFKGAFKNMGKWALMGFGIGNMICPIVGGLIGGLIGGAIGGILGWIGGEKISKAMESVGNFFKNAFIKAIEGLKNTWSKTKDFVKLVKDKTIMKSKQFKEAIGGLVSSSIKAVSEKITKVKEFASNSWNNLKNFGNEMFSSFKDGNFFTNFIPDLLSKIKEKLYEGFNIIKESPIGKFIQDLFTNITNGINKFFNENPIGKWMDSHIMNPIKNAFGQIGAWFSYIGNAFEEGGMSGVLNAMTVGMIKKDKTTGLTAYDSYKQNLLNPIETVEDAIIKTDGSVIKTNPKDTLIALKNIPLSLNSVKDETNRNLNDSLSQMEKDENLENKLVTIIDVLSQILAKDIKIQMPPQTRNDLDILMTGGMI